MGMRVAVETSAGDKVEGEVFTYDAKTNCVVLGAPPYNPAPPPTPTHPLSLIPVLCCGAAEEFIPQTQKKNIRIMKASMIKQVKVLSTPESRGGGAAVRPRSWQARRWNLAAHTTLPMHCRRRR